ncbi:MAG TPA: ABC transporter permease [Pyrinomonadaceae bacterium]|nr:ABC transporter permease [Pyrinomonadaceae bacterium]
MNDLKYSFRVLVQNPAFTAMAVLSLALGIGANAAIFSLLDAVLLKTLPVRHPEQLVFLENGEPEAKRSSNISYRSFEQLRSQNQVLASLCFFSFATRVNAVVNGNAEVVEGQLVSGNFFTTLGVQPAAGRMLLDADDSEANPQLVAVISYSYWQRRFGASALAIGQNVVLNNHPFTIVGVAPPEFFGVIVGSAPDVYLPSASGDQILPRRVRSRPAMLPFVLARLREGVGEQQAQPALELAVKQIGLADLGPDGTVEKRDAIQQRRLHLLPASHGFNVLRQQFSTPLRLLMGVVGLVLLIACANVANLLLARAAAREKEIALRVALGASRWRIIRQLLTESLLLAVIGGGLGLLLASWCSSLLLSVFSSGQNPVTAGAPLTINTPLDLRILGFTAAVSLLAAIVFGLAPAWRAARLDLTPSLKASRGAGGSTRSFGWGRTLVVAQVALSFTLLIGAGLFIRSLSRLRNVDIGFQREHVLVFNVDPQLINYERKQIPELYKQMLERIRHVPGVESVTLTRQGLLSGGGTQGSIRVPGFEPRPQENTLINVGGELELDVPYFAQVGPDFCRTLGMTILHGRDISAQDNETAPKVALVNEAFARYYFNNQDPIGKRFDRGSADGGEVEIVGLVKDAKANNVREQTPRTFYVPFLQDSSSWRETSFQIRTTGDPLDLAAALRREVQTINPNLPLFRVRTLESQVDESLGQERLVTTLASLFGVLALLLACAGLYGVLSYSVSRRTQEIGIRMALGARRSDVLGLFIGHGMMLVMLGLAIGVAVAFLLTRWISSLLFGVSATDLTTFAIVTSGLAVVGLVACLVPARRATKVDPLVALRYE